MPGNYPASCSQRDMGSNPMVLYVGQDNEAFDIGLIRITPFAGESCIVHVSINPTLLIPGHDLKGDEEEGLKVIIAIEAWGSLHSGVQEVITVSGRGTLPD